MGRSRDGILAALWWCSAELGEGRAQLGILSGGCLSLNLDPMPRVCQQLIVVEADLGINTEAYLAMSFIQSGSFGDCQYRSEIEECVYSWMCPSDETYQCNN